MSASDNRSDAGLKHFYSRSQQSSLKHKGVPGGKKVSYADRNIVAFEQDTPDHMDISYYSYVGTSRSDDVKENMMRKRQAAKMMKDRS